MKKRIGVILAIGCAGLVASVSVARPATKDGSLEATVGPGFSITLTQNGTRVSNLAPGSYTITVNDKSAEHNFHLSGPGVDQATDIEGTGTTTWNVTLQNGRYTYVCDAHAATMVGKFTVGDAPATTTPAGGVAPLNVKAALKAVHRSLTVTGTASRTAKITVTLMLGAKKVASKTASGKKVVLAYKAKGPGKYVAKVVAKAGATSRSASTSLAVK